MSTRRAQCLDDNEILDLVKGKVHAPAATAFARHLSDCSWCRGVMDAVAAGHSSNAATDPRSPADPAMPALEPGSAVGRYRIERLLGAGAMGVVYAAHDPELDRRVALKLIRGAGDSGSVARRLVRESRAMVGCASLVSATRRRARRPSATSRSAARRWATITPTWATPTPSSA